MVSLAEKCTCKLIKAFLSKLGFSATVTSVAFSLYTHRKQIRTLVQRSIHNQTNGYIKCCFNLIIFCSTGIMAQAVGLPQHEWLKLGETTTSSRLSLTLLNNKNRKGFQTYDKCSFLVCTLTYVRFATPITRPGGGGVHPDFSVLSRI
jgi:hypothetical protein